MLLPNRVRDHWVNFARPLGADHEDHALLSELSREIIDRAGGWDKFVTEIPRRLRQALDEVIDTPRTGRFVFSQTEKTEKTYVGTKVEILLREFLKFEKGLLDLKIGNFDVDVKNTVTGNWMIPTEAVGKPCILVSEDEVQSICSFGLIVCRPFYLTKGSNKDGKVSISAAGREHIHWLLRGYPYQPNFWEAVPDAVRRDIMLPRSGNGRLVALFKAFQGQPISRRVVESIARQKDFMKRLRDNGGIRDDLGPRGVVLMSGTYDRGLAIAFGIHNLADDEFVACRVVTPEQYAAVRASNRHPGVAWIAPR